MWKNKEVVLWKMIFIRLSVMLVLLALSRYLLYIFNIGNFPGLSTKELLRLFFVGFRFDIYTLVIFNIPLLVFYGIPLKVKYNKIYKKIIDIVFIITNSIAIALNLIDVIYFRYLDKRMTSELFEFFVETNDNQGSMLLNFLTDFWFMVVIFFVFLFIIILLTRKTRLKSSYCTKNYLWYINQSISFLLIIGLSIIGIRGGFQLKPMGLVTATSYTSTENIPLVLNTPFTICRGASGNVLKKINFVDEDIIDSLYCPIHNNVNNNRFIKKEASNYNLILIILESFGQEMISYYNTEREHSITPFLDSLLSQSLTFDGMANGRRSIEALPSIFSGLPSLMSTDYPSSRYAANHLEGFGNILKTHGYKTAFFHGGNNGTMNFDATSKSNGFDDYYGRNEYNNKSDYDGTWGIFDGPFLQYVANTLNEYQNPFAAVIFTLSSHHPYTLPETYVLPDPDIPTTFEKTVRYADDALAAFFRTISQYEWSDSTIFVIIADHVNPEHQYEEYRNGRSIFQIPIAFYSPNIIEHQDTKEIAQQVDLGISILSALNIQDTVFSFGRNVFDSIQKPVFISYLNNIYQFSDGHYFMQSDGMDIKAVYDIKKDPYLKNDLYNEKSDEWDALDRQFKLRLQQFNNRMINNKLYIKR